MGTEMRRRPPAIAVGRKPRAHPSPRNESRRPIDLDRLRSTLRGMSRGNLLIVAERAIELVPRAKLATLFRDMLQVEDFTISRPAGATLLDKVRAFHAAALRGEYYESFNVNSSNFMQQSSGTEAFIAEMDRLLALCVRAARKAPERSMREAFELLFDLIRHVDEAHDDVVFFADEGGSWQFGVNWRSTLEAYFRCLAGEAPPEEYARMVDRAIRDFEDFQRPRHLAAARQTASKKQRAARRRLRADH